MKKYKCVSIQFEWYWKSISMRRCVHVNQILSQQQYISRNIISNDGADSRIQSVILKDPSGRIWTMSSAELPVSNQWFRVEVQRRVDGSIDKASNLLMHFTASSPVLTIVTTSCAHQVEWIDLIEMQEWKSESRSTCDNFSHSYWQLWRDMQTKVFWNGNISRGRRKDTSTAIHLLWQLVLRIVTSGAHLSQSSCVKVRFYSNADWSRRRKSRTHCDSPAMTTCISFSSVLC